MCRLGARDGEGAVIRACGECAQSYDDVDHWTYCPHDWFPPGWFVTRLLAGDTLAAHYVDRLAAAVVEADHLAWYLRVGEPELAHDALARLDGRLGALRQPSERDVETSGARPGFGEVPGSPERGPGG